MRRNPCATLLLIAFSVAVVTAQQPTSDDRAAMLRRIDAQRDHYSGVAKEIWGFAEVGYQEQKRSALLQQQLRAAGFEVTAGVAGIPTAFVATFGSGKPIAGIVGEFDALPGLSQEAQTANHHAIRRERARSWMRTQPARHRRPRVRDCRERLAHRIAPHGHVALLRHAR